MRCNAFPARQNPMCSPEAQALQALLADEITRNGPLGLDRFMGLVLGHPELGYYMRRDPFGQDGDFTTAPEISQIFGEMLGLWLVDVWMQMGRPSPFILLEAGPGRGTLMADILRVSKDFSTAAQVHLLEMSPVLRQKQRENLQNYTVQWHDSLESVPDMAPLFFIANEFFDALPFRQFVYDAAAGWSEYAVTMQGQGGAGFEMIRRNIGAFDPVGDFEISAPEDGSVFEVSADRSEFMAALSRRIRAQGGAALVLDYGHLEPGYGDTFQALHKHQPVHPLSHVGDADLTSHVDFSTLAVAARAQGVTIAGMSGQGAFLNNLGIHIRAERLGRNATDKQRDDIQKALHRLTHSDEMGSLFKVLGIYHYDTQLDPAGF